MILYQMAKRLEERNRLQHTIYRNVGDVNSLLTQKERVEEQLLTQANVWATGQHDEFMLDVVIPGLEEVPTNESLY